MPRLTAALPRYRKHAASRQAVVTLHGKDHYLGPYNSKSSKALYDRLIAEYCASGRVATPGPDAITIIELIAAYWRFVVGYYRKDGQPTSEQASIRIALRELKRLYGSVPADDFGPIALKAIRNIWIEKKHARGTINQNVARIVRMFRWAVAEELVAASTHQSLAAVSGLQAGRSDAKETGRILPVDADIVEQTIPHLPSIVADMIRLQLLTGMRPAEVCKVRPKDIDQSNDVWEFRPQSHKTSHHGRDRVVYIGPAAQSVLSPYLRRDATAFCFCPLEVVAQKRAERSARRVTPAKWGNAPGRKRDKPVRKGGKPRAAGDRYTPDSYRRAIYRACDLAFVAPKELSGKPLKDWRKKHRWAPNQLRHAAATTIRKRFGLEAAQVSLGHAAADVTQVYAERDADKAREVARAIG